jgi:hypothetical protein
MKHSQFSSFLSFLFLNFLKLELFLKVAIISGFVKQLGIKYVYRYLPYPAKAALTRKTKKPDFKSVSICNFEFRQQAVMFEKWSTSNLSNCTKHQPEPFGFYVWVDFDKLTFGRLTVTHSIA